MRRVSLLAGLAALIGLAVLPSSAAACSCVAPDAAEILAERDAAFIGVLKSIRTFDEGADPPPPGTLGFDAIYRYRVRRDFGADLGRYVRVAAPSGGAGCGLRRGRKRAHAMGLERAGGRWTSNLCLMVEPGDLRDAAASSSRREGPVGCS